MKLRVGTFNVENLLTRHRFEAGGRTETAAAMSLFHFPRADERDAVERSLAVALEDDKRQMTALAIAEAQADLWMLQEVDSLASLQAFFANYVHRIADHRYGHFTLVDGNDRRNIDIGFAARRDLLGQGQVKVRSHKELTFAEAGVHDRDLAALGIGAHGKVFARDCLEIEISLNGRRLSLFGCHFKSMNNGRDDGRAMTLPVRRAEARAVRWLIEQRFGGGWRETKTVSDRLNSRAIACMASVCSPSDCSTIARGLPAWRRAVKTSRVTKRRFIGSSCRNFEINGERAVVRSLWPVPADARIAIRTGRQPCHRAVRLAWIERYAIR